MVGVLGTASCAPVYLLHWLAFMAKRVVGIVDDAPAEKTPVSHYEQNESNRILGYRIWFYVRVEGRTQLAAWREVFPGSTAADNSARAQCGRFLRWYEDTYPPTFHMAANAFRLHPYRLMSEFNAMLGANRWVWDNKVGGLVETNAPDYRTRLGAMKELFKLVGKSELWRKQFLEQDQSRPTDLVTTPRFETVEEFEEWAQKNDVLKKIAAKRAAATEERDRRLAEEGRLPMPKRPPMNGSHQ